jgi:hypothetical protein
MINNQGKFVKNKLAVMFYEKKNLLHGIYLVSIS